MLLGFEGLNYIVPMLLHYNIKALINQPNLIIHGELCGHYWQLAYDNKGHIKNKLLDLNIGLNRSTQVQFEIVFCFECL